jgi:hypothetical protein
MGRDWKKRASNKKLIESLAYEKKVIFNKKAVFNKSIVFQHFVKKISKFSDLGIKE